MSRKSPAIQPRLDLDYSANFDISRTKRRDWQERMIAVLKEHGEMTPAALGSKLHTSGPNVVRLAKELRNSFATKFKLSETASEAHCTSIALHPHLKAWYEYEASQRS